MSIDKVRQIVTNLNIGGIARCGRDGLKAVHRSVPH